MSDTVERYTESRNRAFIRVSLPLLADLFRTGAHAFAITGGVPANARIVGVQTDHSDNTALLFVEADTPSSTIKACIEGTPCPEMRPTVWTLNERGWLPKMAAEAMEDM